MEQFDKKAHWDKIYQTKSLNEVSWFQPKPETSLHFFNEFKVDISASIIDIGGGDSLLVDHLLDMGYQHITVLDICATALERAKIRLGNRAALVKWIEADASTFVPEEQYDFWHDRAAFHFLTSEQEIEHYLQTVQQSIKPSGILVMGTFSEQGPTKCSGIEIKQYSEKSMSVLLTDFFEKIKCITVDHKTPFETIQQFIFCSFRKPQLIV